MAKTTRSNKSKAKSGQQSKSVSRTATMTASPTAAIKKSLPAPSKGDHQPTGKIATITTLLRRPKGASIDDLMKATGWQAHSVRGAISASIKKKLGLTVTSEKSGPVRLYRIAGKSGS